MSVSVSLEFLRCAAEVFASVYEGRLLDALPSHQRGLARRLVAVAGDMRAHVQSAARNARDMALSGEWDAEAVEADAEKRARELSRMIAEQSKVIAFPRKNARSEAA